MFELVQALDVVGAFLFTASGNEQPGLDPDVVRPGYVALGIFLAMCVALALLMWSFAKVSRQAREPWEGEEDDVDA
ncbi:MAG: hypothetical protein QM621_12505 [Aeromicrobium sp.]|uniref:hypothetical protein n=1 Tax=Aeromicrobium sp. TaxID=1871063 RepID=UPI0039E6EC18